jgi:quercetin dioxygenase-like cupin family protein
MLTRRGFAACALCAVAGFVATGAEAQTSGVKRTILNQTDGPVDGYVTISVRAEIEAGATVARHTHPGVESAYVLEGAAELSVEGQAARQLQAGDAFVVPANTPHGAKNGPAKLLIASTYVVEKGKPLASPA